MRSGVVLNEFDSVGKERLSGEGGSMVDFERYTVVRNPKRDLTSSSVSMTIDFILLAPDFRASLASSGCTTRS